MKESTDFKNGKIEKVNFNKSMMINVAYLLGVLDEQSKSTTIMNDSEDSDDGNEGFPGNGHGNNKKDERAAKVTAKLYVDGQEKGSKNGFITPDNYRAGLTFEFPVTGYNGNLQTSNIDVVYSVTDVDNMFECNSSNTEISIVKTN